MKEFKNEYGLIPKKISDKTIGKVKVFKNEIENKGNCIMVIIDDTIIYINLDKKAFNID